MNQESVGLHVVLNASGGEPLLFECSWGGRPKHPNLLNVGRAKLRLRALCILFLLAKHAGLNLSTPDADLTFEADVKGTWIGTLANDFEAVIDWVKERFFIREHELFLFASVGAIYNLGGKHPMIVQFFPKKLPLNDIKISIKDSINSKARLLQPQEYLTFAVKLEGTYWKQPAIKHLRSTPTSKVRPASQITIGGHPHNGPDTLLLACAAELESTGASHPSDHLRLMFQLFMEKAFDIYRVRSTPLFSYLGTSIISAKLPFFWATRNWNPMQIVALHDHVFFYAHTGSVLVPLVNHGASRFFHDAEPYPPQTSEDNAYRFVEAAIRIFEDMLVPPTWDETRAQIAKRLPSRSPPYLEGFVNVPKHILPELGTLMTILNEVLNSPVTGIAAGGYLIHKILFIDFLTEICLPFYAPKSIEKKALRSFPRELHRLKNDILHNVETFYRLCNDGNILLAAVEAGRRLFNAQAEFYIGMHRLILLLEDRPFEKPKTHL